MKYILTTICLTLLIGNATAQKVVPYKAVVKTKYGTERGVLHKVDSTSIVLNTNDKFISLSITEVKCIKIRRYKRPYRAKTYLDNSAKETTTYQLNGNDDLVDRYGNKAPTLRDEIVESFWFAALNGVANVIAFPIHAINPNLAKYNLQEGLNKNQLDELSYYSIVYQVSPNILAELRKMKEISAKAKSQ
ncbi:MAG: hypothetical protein REI64_04610 [Pedobacter sp.]|uniref:hypothetical protein n=1 Tax=Pedobacter sp. TaxID=1411316 RepID=UPI002808678C|nr:hypothetical protein [Pedobacter sp.]MDQ8004060.1 hypothetical protein [Pedobacter sp.]